MNRQQLVRLMAQETQSTQVQTAKVLATILASIEKALAEGETLYLPGFGNFELRHRLTPEKIDQPVTVTPAFKPAAGFKKLVNGA